jgi:D-inositol-3-phosphate glycosyltransferase
MDRPALRILHVTPYYAEAWAYGGMPRVVTALARAQARRGHEVTVCATDVRDAGTRLLAPPGPARRRAWPPRREPDGVALRIFPNLSNRLAYRLQLFLPLGLGAYLRAAGPAFDVAHLHGCHHVPGVIAARGLGRAGIPYVLTPHGTAARLERRRRAKWVFDHTVGRGVLPGAARVLALSAAERRQLRGLGVPEATLRIVPGVLDVAELDAPRDPDGFRARHGLGGARVVLFLGKLTPRKRVDDLVRAVARLGSPAVRLVIAGNDLGAGPMLRALVRRLGLDSVTRFTGLLPGAARLDALAAADVVAYPSSDEAFGLVPLEALGCGTPVVVGDDSGCGETVGTLDGGRVVRTGDVAALANALAEVLAAPGAWRPAAARGGAQVRQRYGADPVCGTLEHVYHELTGGVRL